MKRRGQTPEWWSRGCWRTPHKGKGFWGKPNKVVPKKWPLGFRRKCAGLTGHFGRRPQRPKEGGKPVVKRRGQTPEWWSRGCWRTPHKGKGFWGKPNKVVPNKRGARGKSFVPPREFMDSRPQNNGWTG